MYGCAPEDFIAGETIEEGLYENLNKPTVMIRDAAGKAKYTTLETDQDAADVLFHLELSKPLSSGLAATLSVGSADLVEAYNKENGTSFKAFPGKVELSGEVSLSSAELVSSDIPVSVQLTPDVLTDVTYAIPLVVKTDNDAAVKGNTHFLFVKNMKGRKMSATKASGIRLFSCMETGTANPLLHLTLRLQSTLQPLFDYAIIFTSGNGYTYDEEGRLKVKASPCQEALNANYEKYVKPLHDIGIKVILCLTGGQCTQLDGEYAREFAREVASYCEAYHLDGVFLDNEYHYESGEGWAGSSSKNSSRLMYELKKAMPDKEILAYLYVFNGFCDVDGLKTDEYLDWALNDYGASITGTGIGTGSENGGFPKSRTGVLSCNWAPAYWGSSLTATRAKNMRNEGYGAFMAYCMDCNTSTWSRQRTQLGYMAKYFYDDSLVYMRNDGTFGPYDADNTYLPKAEW